MSQLTQKDICKEACKEIVVLNKISDNLEKLRDISKGQIRTSLNNVIESIDEMTTELDELEAFITDGSDGQPKTDEE